MDFGTLLHVAKRNSDQIGKDSQGKFYSTKFSAPKKESKEKKLSDNIKKFLAKREQEEREKARIEKQKRDDLLASRDEKAKNKIKKMLKVIKSANKSVLEDAIDIQNTAVTLQGPEQPDEDDYGYVSQEASALYQKYMDKVKSLPVENKFAPSRPTSRSDLAGTKDRVRAAIQKEQGEGGSGSRIKSSKVSEVSSSSMRSISPSTTPELSSHRRKNLYDPQVEREMEEKRKREEDQKKSKSRKPAPPPMDFQQLLKLAEKKQFEPVEIVVETKKEPERLLTKKEKKELEERRQYLLEREQRKKEMQQGGGGNKMQPNGRFLKLNGTTSTAMANNDKVPKASTKPIVSNHSSATLLSKDNFKKPNSSNALSNNSKIESISKSKSEPKINGVSHLKSKYPSQPTSASTSIKKKPSSSNAAIKSTSKALPKQSNALLSTLPNQKSQSKHPHSCPTREFPPKDPYVRKRGDVRPVNPSDVQRSRQFPSGDVVRGGAKLMKKQPIKRRIYDDDDDSEYDSELDDFIDDGPEEGENYSSYIKEIFGYDKSRYRDIDDDDRGMESTFAQQMKEEYESKKIGLLEDLEDMRQEAEEKKRKAIKKRKLK